jgi:D-sedoheptulose 7-phosphate isomerase
MSAALITTSLDEHHRAMESVRALSGDIIDCAERMAAILVAGGRVLVCGNGGSAADAQHFAAELTGRFEADRRGYPAIALTTDTSALTAIGNDYGFEAIFSRQLEALGRRGDMLIALSTSGTSPNILSAVRIARREGIFVVGLAGGDGGTLGREADLPLIVASSRTARVQEAHIVILHLLCELFEARI